jgi:hypothetical protein
MRSSITSKYAYVFHERNIYQQKLNIKASVQYSNVQAAIKS